MGNRIKFLLLCKFWVESVILLLFCIFVFYGEFPFLCVLSPFFCFRYLNLFPLVIYKRFRLFLHTCRLTYSHRLWALTIAIVTATSVSVLQYFEPTVILLDVHASELQHVHRIAIDINSLHCQYCYGARASPVAALFTLSIPTTASLHLRNPSCIVNSPFFPIIPFLTSLISVAACGQFEQSYIAPPDRLVIHYKSLLVRFLVYTYRARRD